MVPLVSPDTVQVVAPVVVHVLAPGLEVTVYPVMGEPPSSVGALHVTVDEAFWPVVAFTLVGGVGGPAGVPVAGDEAGPVPTALVAVTVKV